MRIRLHSTAAKNLKKLHICYIFKRTSKAKRKGPTSKNL